MGGQVYETVSYTMWTNGIKEGRSEGRLEGIISMLRLGIDKVKIASQGYSQEEIEAAEARMKSEA